MKNWKDRLSELFPEIRKAFSLEEEAAAGASNFWHQGVSSGTVLPIKSFVRQGHLLWFTPETVTGGGRIDSYALAEEGEVMVYPKTTKENNAYLVAIDPAPGLGKAFDRISDDALIGLLAHELAEVTLAQKEKNYHFRITHHGLPEERVDEIAAQKGYKNQVKHYLEFLLGNVSKIRERPNQPSIFDSLKEMGVQTIGAGVQSKKAPTKTVVDFYRSQLTSRIDYLDGKISLLTSSIA